MNYLLFNNTPENILSSWIALEVLSPQLFKKPDDKRLLLDLEKTLPWLNGGEKSKPKYKLFYEIILGTIDLKSSVEKLLHVFEDKRIERPIVKGEAILASVIVDSRGFVTNIKSIAVSSYAWGFQKVLTGALNDLPNWSIYEAIIIQGLKSTLIKFDDDDKPIPLTKSDIETAYGKVCEAIGVDQVYLNQPRLAIRRYEYYKNDDEPEPSILNSFYIKDLAQAKTKYENGSATSNLDLYLGIEKPRNRFEILSDSRLLDDVLSPGKMPLSSWPTPGQHSLVLLQQAAVNLAMDDLIDGGILAVNGPPGTGKTTLLRDIVAAVITEKAEIMAECKEPSSMFISTDQKISMGNGWARFYKLDEKLKGYEITFASSNNKAVENISTELPSINSIENSELSLCYFKDLATQLFDKDCWGIVASVLGNAQNRNKFKNLFWWDKDYGMSTYLAHASGSPQVFEVKDHKSGVIIESRPPRIVTNNSAPNTPEEALKKWNSERDYFQKFLGRSKKLILDLEDIKTALTQRAGLLADKNALSELVSNNKITIKRLKKDLKKNNEYFDHNMTLILTEKSIFIDHLKSKPNFLKCFFKTTSYQAWILQRNKIETIVSKLTQELEIIKNKITHIQDTLNECLIKKQELERNLKFSELKIASNEEKISEAKIRFGDNILDEEFWAQDRNIQQMTSPWCDKMIQKVRNDVFRASINLNKAFIDAASKPIKHNLSVLMSLFSGGKLSNIEQQALLTDIWSSLFLVVPCISTTFASVERMFSELPDNSIGWLLIDEAGQALPQAAVGAIMRSKRILVVGDPLQIEPVVTLPEKLTKQIFIHFNVDPSIYNAPFSSVQTLADSAGSYFAEFESMQGSRSVGIPLLVHRRCADPMFSISNKIAYSNYMVHSKSISKSPIKEILGDSCWFDTEGEGADKYCPEEGELVIKLLKKIRDRKVNPNLYIITPFVKIQDNLRRLIHESNILEKWVDNPQDWIYERVGTVHTVQGRESEAVIFVLGCPDNSQKNARNWAGSKPNLLNVAVTRAKEVLYVIGKRSVWIKAGVFETLGSHLPSISPSWSSRPVAVHRTKH